jgi:hypothetical protein
MALRLAPDDTRFAWFGAVSFEHGDGWIKPWRIPYDQRLLFGKTSQDDMMLSRAGMPSGVRIAFRSDTTAVRGQTAPLTPNAYNVPETLAAKVDLVCGGELFATFALGEGTEFSFEGLPDGEKSLELWLPEYREIKLRHIELSDGASVAPIEDDRLRWTIYGSSNTQSRGAQSPFYTWPAVAAREQHLNHINLSYGGQCHLDPMAARLMRGIAADVLAMEVGVNIYSSATMNARAIRAAMIGFVKIVREGHPTTPLAVMSAIYGWERETTLNDVHLTLADTREITQEAVEALQAGGDSDLYYFNGLDFLGEPEKVLIEDHVHPNVEGYKVLGHKFGTRVLGVLTPARTPAGTSLAVQ